MSWIDGLRHRVRTLVNPRAYDRELDEELRFHLELDAMQQRDADSARRRFGNRTYYKEETRRTTWLGWLDVLAQDVTFTWRSLRRSPGLMATVVATLALGIGANAAAFSLLDRLYLRAPGGVEAPDAVRRFWMEHHNTDDGVPAWSQAMNIPMFRAVASATRQPQNVAVFGTDWSLRLGKSPTAPKVRVVYAASNYFGVLGVRPALGRLYAPDEDRFGSGAPVAVVSDAFWRDRLAGDSAALGKTIFIGKDAHTVIGVLPPAFRGLDLQPADVWIPLASMPAPPWINGPWWESPNMYSFRAVWRPAAGTPERAVAARAALAVRALNRQFSPRRPDTLMNVAATPLVGGATPAKPGQEMIISTRLAGVAAIVLLIACANVTNLLLARAVRRRREIAVRLALGVTRSRLARLLATEAGLLALLSGAVALLVAWWGGAVLRSLILPEIDWADSALDGRVLGFTAVVSLAAGLVAGIVPAIQASRPRLTSVLSAGARESAHRSRLRGALVVTQAALSVMLLAGAALFVRSLHNVEALDIGFDASRLYFGHPEFADGEAPPGPVIAAAIEEVARGLEGRPGVEAVARSGFEPMRGLGILTFFSGADSTTSHPPTVPTMSGVTPSFFRATGLRVSRGRGFAEAGTAPEVVVNEAMATLFWAGREPVGQCMRFLKRDNPCYTVVGVVENARRNKLMEAEPAPQFYLPLGNMPMPWSGTTLIVRARSEASTAATAELRRALARAFPAAEPVVTPMSKNLEPEYRPWRLGASLFTGLGLLALAVALVGVYSTVSYGVSQRTREFGVRLALGAGMPRVLRQVIAEGVRTVAIGVVLGVLLALAAGRLVASMLYGVAPRDPAVLTLVSLTLLVVAAVAALVPAWRAARVDPATALRAD